MIVRPFDAFGLLPLVIHARNSLSRKRQVRRCPDAGKDVGGNLTKNRRF